MRPVKVIGGWSKMGAISELEDVPVDVWKCEGLEKTKDSHGWRIGVEFVRENMHCIRWNTSVRWNNIRSC